MKLFLAPHSDDETLFGAFTVLRERPLVAVVMQMEPERRKESRAATQILRAKIDFLDWKQERPLVELLRTFGQPEMVYAPASEERGNTDHNTVSEAARRAFEHVTYYLTYTEAGKSTGTPVPFEPGWPLLKLKALACYESQINRASCQPHFLREQMEYYAP